MIRGGGGHSHAKLSIDESIRHIENIFQRYCQYGDLSRFMGVCVEVGPGDSAGVAMLMRKSGADEVKLIDRFYAPRDMEKQKRIYEVLSNKFDLAFLKNGMAWDEKNLHGIEWKIGLPAEDFFRQVAESGAMFDTIVSCAVMEHLYDPLGCLIDMTKCLKEDGTMIHCIDFRDHGMFEPRYHPLKYLTVPRSLYRMMTRYSGDQNRVLIHDYRKVLDDLSRDNTISYDFYAWFLVGGIELDQLVRIDQISSEQWQTPVAIVDKWRHELAADYRTVPSRDLAVAGICLVVKKTGVPAQ
ncbi:MAG: methyltransferase domain-containing protein [Deltaproteobacteria bacterium]|nr:methyltransferase domain-containing protein [Deltaproteobacteria bacterium]